MLGSRILYILFLFFFIMVAHIFSFYLSPSLLLLCWRYGFWFWLILAVSFFVNIFKPFTNIFCGCHCAILLDVDLGTLLGGRP